MILQIASNAAVGAEEAALSKKEQRKRQKELKKEEKKAALRNEPAIQEQPQVLPRAEASKQNGSHPRLAKGEKRPAKPSSKISDPTNSTAGVRKVQARQSKLGKNEEGRRMLL